MNTKLKGTILLSSVVALSVIILSNTANATNITGITGNNGIYNINPENVTTDPNIGFRRYENFDLSKGDVANLNFEYNGQNINQFVNLVDNQIQINGIVNTMRNGNFHPGNAVFISPNGMVVGASGVLNVGSLTVITPLQNQYADFKKDPINNLPTMPMPNNLTAPVEINGKVFARNRVDVVAGKIGIGGQMLTSFDNNDLINNNAYADALFNSLVNTGNMTPAIGFSALNNKIFLTGTNGVNVSGQIKNFNDGQTNGEVYIEGMGGGVNITGSIESAGDIYISNAKGNRASAAGINLESGVNALKSGANVTIVDTSRNGININGAIIAKGDVSAASNAGITVDRKIKSGNDVTLTNNSRDKILIRRGVLEANHDVNITNKGSIVLGTEKSSSSSINTPHINPYYVHADNDIRITTTKGEILNAGTEEVLLNAGHDIHLKQPGEPGSFTNFFPRMANCIGSGCIGMPGFNPPTNDFSQKINAVAGNLIYIQNMASPAFPESGLNSEAIRGIQKDTANAPLIKDVINTFKRENVALNSKKDMINRKK